jgi:hypothetical protein
MPLKAGDRMKKSSDQTLQKLEVGFGLPKRIGRPSELTPANAKRIVQAIRVGMTKENSARLTGIARQTFYAWMKQGKRDRDANLNTQHSVFLDGVEHALLESEKTMLKTVFDDGASGAKWLLARRFPVRWGDRMRLEAVITAELEKVITVLDDEE